MIPERRFEVWDELGKLRTFYTNVSARTFVGKNIDGNLFIIERKALTNSERFENMVSQVGEALF